MFKLFEIDYYECKSEEWTRVDKSLVRSQEQDGLIGPLWRASHSGKPLKSTVWFYIKQNGNL